MRARYRAKAGASSARSRALKPSCSRLHPSSRPSGAASRCAAVSAAVRYRGAQCVRVCVCRHLAPPQVYDVVGAFFQVGGDMRGKQDADAFVLGKLEKDLQQFVPETGSSPLVGSSSTKKPRPVRVPEPGRTLPSCPSESSFTRLFHPARTARDTGGKPSLSQLG